jgi:hypothetical protein
MFIIPERGMDACRYASAMLLYGALFALFMTGFWLYGLTDVILTPAPQCRSLSKQAWVAVVAVTFIAGALAWLIVRRPTRDQADPGNQVWTDADDAVARHPAGRGNVTGPQAVFKGPDDDPEFLSALDQAIRRNPPVS